MTTDLGPHCPGHTTTQPCPPNPGLSQIHNQSSKRQDPSSWKQPLRSIVQVSVSNQNHPAFLKPPPNAHSPGKQTQIRLSIYLICAVTPCQTEKLPYTHRVVDHLSWPTHLTRSPSVSQTACEILILASLRDRLKWMVLRAAYLQEKSEVVLKGPSKALSEAKQ